MNSYLFVYGTLLRSAVGAPGENERWRLQCASQFIGAATIQGRLYDLGRYPGLTLSTDPAELVHGEVMCLWHPRASLEWLDAYEGLTLHTSTTVEYLRIEVPVKLQNGHELTAWVYVYQGDYRQARRLEDGIWNSSAGPRLTRK